MEEEDIAKDVEKSGQAGGTAGHVSIIEPMLFWVILLIIALVLRMVLTFTGLVGSTGSIYNLLNSFSNYVLFMPGAVILPLVVGAIIGAQVGIKAHSMELAQRGGLLNGVYAAVVYLVAIIVIWAIVYYVIVPSAPSVLPSVLFLIGEWLVAPVAILILVSFFFAVLSHSRKVA